MCEYKQEALIKDQPDLRAQYKDLIPVSIQNHGWDETDTH